jgi:hypothetical protein
MEEVTNCFMIRMHEGLRKTMKYQPGYMVDMHIGYYITVRKDLHKKVQTVLQNTYFELKEKMSNKLTLT